MRGKKSDIEGESEPRPHFYNSLWPDLLGNNKRAGFVGMRGKKAYDLENQNELLNYLAHLYHNQKNYNPPKRAGFVGMRGKRFYTEATGDEVMLQKKAAFVGMRGRRTPSEIQYDEESMPYIHEFVLDNDEMPQKVRRAGFVGMRG
jgi:hypothetical protein